MKKLRFSILMVVFSGVSACGDDETEGAAPGTTACEKLTGVARKVGCEVRDTCTFPEACERENRALLDCIASDYSQCQCESSGDLNCEGAWKADEGPAKCVAEYQLMDACEEANDSD